MRGEAPRGPRSLALARRTGSEYPLTPEQQHIWLIHQLGGETYYLNLSHAFLLQGPLDVTSLERAINEIVRRHENLRSSFPPVNGKPCVRISPESWIPLTAVNLSDSPEEGRREELQRLITVNICRPFDIFQGPVIRATIYRLAPTEHALLVTIHHIVTDRISYDVFARELAVLYDAYSRGLSSPLEELPVQYGDFAAWLHDWMTSDEASHQIEYWRARLSDMRPLNLAADMPRPQFPTFRAERFTSWLPQPLWEGLKALAFSENVTRFTAFLVLYAMLLRMRTDTDEISIAVPVSSRKHNETQGLMGYFLNTVVFQVDLAGNPTFRDVLRRGGRLALEVLARSDVPFEHVLHKLPGGRDPGRPNIVETVFAYTNDVVEPASRNVPLAIRALDPFFRSSWLDLTFGVNDFDDVAQIHLDYLTDLFLPLTIERMMRHFEKLLSEVIADPDRRIGELALLSDEEREELAGWNRTEKEYGERGCIHELIEEQVKRSPDGVAVVYEQEQVSYEELNRQANIWAHRLRREGVGPETVVGVHLERSVELVVALLAVMKAGGAYLPLDPGYPEQRLKYMVEDAGVEVVVTEPGLGGKLPGSVRQIWIEGGVGEAGQEQSEAESGVEAGNLVYVIYTSGSTGQPKGVGNTHRGLVNRLSWMQSEYELRGSDRVLQKTPFSFDVSFWEFFWPLVNGGVLIVARPEGHRDPKYLTEVMENEEVTLAHFVPSMLGAFLEHGEVERCGSLRKVFCSGEELGAELGRRFFARSEAELHNLYGPTEAAIDVTYRECRKEGEGVIPIGRPIANTQVYVLDREMRQRPVGVSGELYIGGVGLARGYMNRADLTAERFVPDPYGGEGGRLYRTGDLARWRADGNLEYIGRIDEQIKIRGFRVEPGETECVLRQHPSVTEAVVISRQDRVGDTRLVAYVVAKEGVSRADELRSFLRERLPEYMVPSAFVTVPDLPLTPNGKLDRKALPLPENQAPASAPTPPSSELEKLIAGVWADVLGLERTFDREESFFDVGGHSLLAVQVVSRLQAVLRCEVPLRTIFESPTISGMALRINTQLRSSTHSELLPIARVPRDHPVRASFSQERLWFLNRLAPGDPSYNVPIALELEGPLDLGVLERTLREIMRRHEVLRTTFEISEKHVVQVVSEVEDWRPLLVDFADAEDSEKQRLLQEVMEREAAFPFDLARGPLLRAAVIRLGASGHVLIVTLHHTITDGWLTYVIVRELNLIYNAFCQGEDSPLPELTIQYADWACWQRDRLTGDRLNSETTFWKQELSGAPMQLDLPADRPRPLVQTHSGAAYSTHIGQKVLEQLRTLARRYDATLFMTLLAALQVLLAGHSGQEDILIGIPVAGRVRSEVESIIGFFVNTLIVRGRCRSNLSFSAFLQEIRDRSIRAFAHQESALRGISAGVAAGAGYGSKSDRASVVHFSEYPLSTGSALQLESEITEPSLPRVQGRS